MKSNLVQRLVTAAIGIPILLAVLFLAPRVYFLAVVVASATVGAVELGGMVLRGSGMRRWLQRVALVALTLVVFWSAYLPALGVYLPLALSAVVVLGAVVGLLGAKPIALAARRTGWMIAGPMTLGLLHLPMAMLPLGAHGDRWVFLAITVAWMGDTGAYFMGRALGRRPLAPAVSPKKTVEGSLGGLLGGTMGALVVCSLLLPYVPWWHALGLGVVGAVFGQMGDLFFSMLKRSAEVKDSGALIPGHGGMLDRIDGLLLCGWVVWVYHSLQ